MHRKGEGNREIPEIREKEAWRGPLQWQEFKDPVYSSVPGKRNREQLQGGNTQVANQQSGRVELIFARANRRYFLAGEAMR